MVVVSLRVAMLAEYWSSAPAWACMSRACCIAWGSSSGSCTRWPVAACACKRAWREVRSLICESSVLEKLLEVTRMINQLLNHVQDRFEHGVDDVDHLRGSLVSPLILH